MDGQHGGYYTSEISQTEKNTVLFVFQSKEQNKTETDSLIIDIFILVLFPVTSLKSFINSKSSFVHAVGFSTQLCHH